MRRAFSIVLVAACGMSAVAGGATAQRSHVTPDLRWAKYPEHHALSGGDAVRIEGPARQLAYFLSFDDPITIVEHYAARWAGEGFAVRRSYSDEEELLTATDDEERRSVVVTKRGRASLVWLSRRALETAASTPDTPRPDDCEVLRSSESRDGGTLREVVAMRCARSPAALVEYYAERFGAPGASLSDGRRAFATFGDAAENLDVAVLGDEVDGQPASTATVRWEARR